MLASVLVSLFIYFLSVRENRAAWKDFRTALLATALTLGAFALWHLVRIPWLIHKRVIGREEVREHWGFGVLGVTVMAALLFGGYSLASSVLQMHALPLTIKIPAPPAPQIIMENPKVIMRALPAQKNNPPKVHQRTEGDNSPNIGTITQGPGSIAQVGGQGNQATINNFGTRLPKLVKVSETGTANPDGSYTTECVLRIESDVAPGHLTFQVNAQGLQDVTFYPNAAGVTSIQLVNVLEGGNSYKATVNGPSGEYLLSIKTSQKTPISIGATFN